MVCRGSQSLAASVQPTANQEIGRAWLLSGAARASRSGESRRERPETRDDSRGDSHSRRPRRAGVAVATRGSSGANLQVCGWRARHAAARATAPRAAPHQCAVRRAVNHSALIAGISSIASTAALILGARVARAVPLRRRTGGPHFAARLPIGAWEAGGPCPATRPHSAPPLDESLTPSSGRCCGVCGRVEWFCTQRFLFSELVGGGDCLGACVDVEFAVEVSDVGVDGGGGEVEVVFGTAGAVLAAVCSPCCSSSTPRRSPRLPPGTDPLNSRPTRSTDLRAAVDPRRRCLDLRPANTERPRRPADRRVARSAAARRTRIRPEQRSPAAR